MSEVGKIIRDARERRGWSQEQLAERIGATQSTIDRIESGATTRSRYMHHIIEELGLVEQVGSAPVLRPTTSKQDNSTEKVVNLPSDLAERVHRFRIDYDIPTEEEALRHLISEGLMHFDHFQSITDRIYKRLKEKKSLKEAARFVLGNHPLVHSVMYDEKMVRYVLIDGFSVEIKSSGIATVLNDQGEFYEFSVGDAPEWAAPENIDPPQLKLREQRNPV